MLRDYAKHSLPLDIAVRPPCPRGFGMGAYTDLENYWPCRVSDLLRNNGYCGARACVPAR